MNRILLIVLFSFASGIYANAETSLTNEPFVHPRLIDELVTWVSDDGDQIISLDLDNAEGSNRFCCDEANGGRGYRRFGEENSGEYRIFNYGVIGQTDSGVYVVGTYLNEGGSASWHDLIYVVIENDSGFEIDLKAGKAELTRPRRVIKKLGQTSLGDRWKGKLKVEGNTLYIGKDHGWFAEETDLDEFTERPDDWEHVVEIVYPASRHEVAE